MAKAKQFEEMMSELEEITFTIERGDLPLEEMIKLYKRGLKLADSCKSRIAAAEAIVCPDDNMATDYQD